MQEEKECDNTLELNTLELFGWTFGEVAPTCKVEHEPAKVYCPECDRWLCRGCAIDLHKSHTAASLHSLEEIEEEEHPRLSGARIISPFVDKVMIVSVLCYLLSHLRINANYTYAEICPLAETMKSVAARVDSGAFFLTKGNVHSYCISEDAFWRLFTDMWVRSVVTGTDNLFLVATSLVWAFFFWQTAQFLFVPIFAAVYTASVVVLSWIERRLPRNRITTRVEQLVSKFQEISGKVGLSVQTGDTGPNTRFRTRKRINLFDLIYYSVSRCFRRFLACQEGATACFQKLLMRSVYFTLAVRFLCIYCGFDRFIRCVLTLVPEVGTVLHRHRTFFAHLNGNEMSNSIFLLGLDRALAWSSILLSGIMMSGIMMFLVPAIVLGIFGGHTYKERRNFIEGWADAMEQQKEFIRFPWNS